MLLPLLFHRERYGKELFRNVYVLGLEDGGAIGILVFILHCVDDW